MKEKVYVCYQPLYGEGGGAIMLAVFKSEKKAKEYIEKYNRAEILRDARYEEMELD